MNLIKHRGPDDEGIYVNGPIGLGFVRLSILDLSKINEIDDYYFKGHFPENPIMPGVLILECMAQASCFLQFNVVDNPQKKMMMLSVVNQAKFIKKVVPGDKLIIYVELIKYRLGTARIKGYASVNNNIVSKADFMATVVDKDE